jgi:hypothetical protein
LLGFTMILNWTVGFLSILEAFNKSQNLSLTRAGYVRCEEGIPSS